jgi:hypothetical protein
VSYLAVMIAPRLSAPTLATALVLLLTGACRRQEVPRSEAPPIGAGGAPAAADAGATPAVAADAAADAGTPAALGDWLDGNIYRFRFEAVRRCAPSSATTPVSVGVVVRVTSKLDDVFVASRDFKLESGGVILDSAILTKAPAGCAPLLAPKQVRAGKSNDGVVVFDVPSDFNPENRPVKLTYQPTRWGGARRVEVVLPPGALGR